MTKELLLTGNASDFLKIGVNAAGRGDLDTLKAVLEIKPHWRTRVGSHGRTMLWEAAYRGRLTVVDYLLNSYDDIDVEARGCYYTPMLVEVSPLCAALLKKRHKVVERLRQAGAQHDVVTTTYLGDVTKVEEQLSEKPSLAKDEFYQHDPHFDATLLHYAVAGNHPEIVKLLISYGASVKPHSNHLIDFAMGHESVEIVQMLLESGSRCH